MGQNKFYEEVKKFWDNRTDKAKFLWNNDLTYYKIEYLKKFLKKNQDILDLGAGDCTIANEISSYVNTITAVEFTDAIYKNNLNINNIIKIKENIYDFIEEDKKYDLILLIGVMGFVTEPLKVYNNCKKMLKKEGTLIILHQSGNDNDVDVKTEIDGFPYYSKYKFWKNEKQELESLGFEVHIDHSPYPENFNKHSNTSFKGFLCKI